MCLHTPNQAGIEESKQKTQPTWNDESEIHEPAEDEFEIFEAIDNVFESDGAFTSGASLVPFKPSYDIGAFIFL